MDLAEKRREARRLKILQNSEDRLKRITGLERNSIKNAPVVEPPLANSPIPKESTKNCLEQESLDDMQFFPESTDVFPEVTDNNLLESTKFGFKLEQLTTENRAINENSPIFCANRANLNSNSQIVSETPSGSLDNLRDFVTDEAVRVFGNFSFLLDTSPVPFVRQYEVFFLSILAIIVNLYLSFHTLQSGYFNEIFAALVTYETIIFFAFPTWLQDSLESKLQTTTRIEYFRTRPLLCLFRFISYALHDAWIYFFAFVCCDFVKYLF